MTNNMTTLELDDEPIGHDVEDESPALSAADFRAEQQHHRRPWWKSSVGLVLVVATILAVIFGLSYHRTNNNSSSSSAVAPSSEVASPVQQQQQGSSSSSTTVAGTDISTPTSSTSGTTTTPAPVRSPTTSSTPAPTFCVQEHFEGCQTDRMGHETPLMAGQALCNHQYRFGVSKSGIFQWYDCALEKTRIIHRNRTISYFSMSSAGVFQLLNDKDQVIWQKAPKMKITVYKECLHNPLLDCPYLHLHRDGVLVLNSVDNTTGQWSDRNAEKAFENLFQS